MKHQKQSARWLVLVRVAVVCVGVGLVIWRGGTWCTATNRGDTVAESMDGKAGLTALLKRSDITRTDIAWMNLVAGSGLGNQGEYSLTNLLRELQVMTARVKAETARHLVRFQRTPQEFNNSGAYFRMLCLVTVLQQDFGTRYSPGRAKPSDGPVEPNEAFFADPRDIFLHGLLGTNRAGTCASLPVLYMAIGRRLGYPLKLVAAKNHLFVRWDGERERLNIEATTQGLTTFDDDYYRRWPFPMTPEEERAERYLVSLNPTEELSVFLSLRAQCLLAAGRWDEALSSQEQVCRLTPHSKIQRELLNRVRFGSRQSKRPNRNHQTAMSL